MISDDDMLLFTYDPAQCSSTNHCVAHFWFRALQSSAIAQFVCSQAALIADVDDKVSRRLVLWVAAAAAAASASAAESIE